jgi:superfamily I DNA/RNA helicase
MTTTWWRDASDLVPEQVALLDIPADKSILIKGPPGSGKTNLLLLRANYLALGDRPNIHVVVFGSLLKNFIQIGGVQYKFPAEKVVTHARLFDTVLRENGIHLDTKAMDLKTARQLRADKVDELIKSGKVGKLYDALLLDEAQDYTPQEILIFSALSPIIIATADEYQKVYDVDSCLGVLEKVATIHHPLTFHFRNGRDICRLADEILRGYPNHVNLTTHSHYDEGAYPVKVSYKNGLSLEDQAKAIADQISTQSIAYPQENIGVFCPRNEEIAIIHSHLSNMGLGSNLTICGSNEFNPKAPIWISTMTAAKGLEFRCVHIAGLDYLSNMGGPQKRLAYTAVTRAKTALSLYYDQKIPGYLERALKVVLPANTAITKDKIFGKG